MDIRILKYNNYYNRIVKYEKTLDGYMKYVIAAIFNANFKPGDNVTTQFNFTYSSALQDKGGDYVIVTSPDESEISRWFIIESVRLLNGQYRLTLRRDLIVDNLDLLLDAPCFIEKATLDNSNPLIFNNENMSFNQIKTSETLLKDKTKCAWIVGYTAKGATTTERITIQDRNPYVYDTVETFTALWNSSKNIDDNVRFQSTTEFNYIWSTPSPNIANFYLGYENYCIPNNETNLTIYNNLNTKYQQSNINTLAYESYGITDNFDKIIAYNGKILKDASGNYFKCVIGSTGQTKEQIQLAVGNVLNEMESIGNGVADFLSYKMRLVASQYTYELKPFTNQTYSYKVNEHYDLQDAPYGMFAIPFNAIKIKCGTSDYIQLTDENAKNIALAVSSSLAEQWGGASAQLYDLQLLPYCPFQDNIAADGSLIISDVKNYTPIEGETESGTKPILSYILWANTSTMRFTIPYTITVTDPKITNECDMWRLSSPNYNGQFEFNAAKNGGVSYFNVDCEYKPYAPHIHIAPNFNLLYGQDFDDGRGLICGGDFSLTQTSDAFATYQRQNANYDNIFNRQIQNMEFNNKQALIKDIVGGVTGAVSSGVTTGAVFGGAAGVVGAGLSAIGAAADIGMNIGARKEALDYTKDLHGYQLGNIKALPNSITKISSLSPDFKLFPILEYYTCTEVEKQALRDKIKYNGMTVMTIGTIRQYLKPERSYIKGKLIRLEGLDEDSNYIDNIAQEIYKGVFI